MERVWVRVLSAAALCAAIGFAAAPGSAAEDHPTTWTITPDSDGWRLSSARTGHLSADTGARTGLITFPAKKLDRRVNTVAAAFDATLPRGSAVAVDVRGLRVDGTWSEWAQARQDGPAPLPQSTDTVQARLVLTAARSSPVVRRIDLTASERATSTMTAAAPSTYRVFATREGLVGGTTANGHVIVERDHFVALPSRRGLADRNGGDYTVRVCTEDNARCEWAPVWDVGPWNTRDDHWNVAREMWQDLPPGKPQAHAAYQDGYNGGKDQFGRRVSNPAGMDLADGTFWDGLRLRDNAWVNVTYQWTGTGPWGVIASAGPVLNVRSQPSSASAQVGLAAKHAQVGIDCALKGQRVTGTQGTSDDWLQLADGMFVSAAYVRLGEAPDPC